MKKIKVEVKADKKSYFVMSKDGVLRCISWLCIPNDLELKKEIMCKAHNTPYSVYPKSIKMYKDLSKYNSWIRIKRKKADYVEHCLTCEQVKVEHQWTCGLLQSLMVSKWKSKHIRMDFFLVPRKKKGYDSIWVIIDWLMKSTHFSPIKKAYNVDKYAQIHVKDIVRLHGVPLFIM